MARSLRTISSFSEAVALANNSRFHYACGAFTRDLARGTRLTRKLAGGVTYINTWRVISPSAPFGGNKDTGYGRESGMDTMLDYARHVAHVTDLVITAHPQHEKLYRHFAFKPVAQPVPYASAKGSPGLPMHLDILELEKHLQPEEHFRHFFFEQKRHVVGGFIRRIFGITIWPAIQSGKRRKNCKRH